MQIVRPCVTGRLDVLSAGTLARKEMKTVQLSDQVTSGKEQWLSWHANFSANRAELLQKVCILFFGTFSLFLYHYAC